MSNIIIRNCCSICNQDKLNAIFNLNNIPVNLNCSSTIENYKYENLSFVQCECCNTIQLDRLIQLPILYGQSHNIKSVGKLWNNYFDLLIPKIQSSINDKTILEIGCPSGKIALNCKNYKKWYIVDPNVNLSLNEYGNIIPIKNFIDNNFEINDNIDIIVHSHLLEHIYEPNLFLKKCFDLLNENGEMIFGIPNMESIAENNICLFLGMCFEHTIFLNKEIVSYILSKNGFKIKEMIDYENHSIIYHVKKHIIYQLYTDIKIKNYYNQFFNGVNVYNKFIDDCNKIIKNSTKPVFIFGASNSTQFLLSMGISENSLNGIIDNCEKKQNKYFYGFNLIIYSAYKLLEKDSIVIIKNSFYVNEITEQIRKINYNTIILN